MVDNKSVVTPAVMEKRPISERLNLSSVANRASICDDVVASMAASPADVKKSSF